MMKSSNYSWPRGVLYKCKGTHTKLQVQVSQVKSSAKYKTQHSITYKLSQSRYNCQVCCYVQVQQLLVNCIQFVINLILNAKKVCQCLMKTLGCVVRLTFLSFCVYRNQLIRCFLLRNHELVKRSKRDNPIITREAIYFCN